MDWLRISQSWQSRNETGEAIFFAICSAILNLLAKAAAVMPVMAALAMIFGRRGNGSYCLRGSLKLLTMCLFLAWTGPLWLAAGYLAETLHYGGSWSRILAPLFAAPGMPWSTGCGAWFLGCLSAAVACNAVVRAGLKADRYSLKQIKWPVGFSLLAAFCFFATFLLINWPFAGLPEGLEWDRAVMAIFRHASREYYMALCPAGAIALLAFNVYANGIERHYQEPTARWLGFWAVAGCLPYTLVTWGSLMGMGLNESVSIAQSFRPQAWALFFLTAALAAWIVLLWKPRWWRPLSLAGFILLLCKTLIPVFMHNQTIIH